VRKKSVGRRFPQKLIPNVLIILTFLKMDLNYRRIITTGSILDFPKNTQLFRDNAFQPAGTGK
jgi:hypothetical protein